MKRIIHVFTGDRFHLVPTVLKGFLQLDIPQYYIIARNKNDERDSIYLEIFNDFKNDEFQITHSLAELKKVSKSFKNSRIVLHGVPYSWMFYYLTSGFSDVNWICWGAGVSLNKKNWKSVLFNPFKTWMYRRFRRVGVLMPQDELSLKKNYGIEDCKLLSYFGSLGSFPYNETDLLKEGGSCPLKKVYLGNNSSSIRTYQPLVERLSRFKDLISINCMINYSFTPSDISNSLQKVGNQIFGKHFEMDTTLYSLNDYYAYMNKCDIYICNVKSQTGLGAIFTCLRLGKRVFLTGINYEFLKVLGASINHVDELDSMPAEEFLQQLSDDVKIDNFRIIQNYLDKDKIIVKWKEFLVN